MYRRVRPFSLCIWDENLILWSGWFCRLLYIRSLPDIEEIRGEGPKEKKNVPFLLLPGRPSRILWSDLERVLHKVPERASHPYQNSEVPVLTLQFPVPDPPHTSPLL